MGLIPGLGIQGIQGCPLEEGIVTPFSILAWRIPLTEEPGGLQSMGSQRDTTKQLSIAQHKTKGFAAGSAETWTSAQVMLVAIERTVKLSKLK